MSKDDKTKYVWISEGGKNSCSECDALDGQEFDDEADVPALPHPNCKCTVQEVIDRASPPNSEDTINIKEALNKLGYYEIPKVGLHEYQDEAMYTAIKEFQKDNDLTVDGKIKPDGETIEKINENLLKAASLSVAGMQGLSLGFSDELHGVSGAVGYGIGNVITNNKKETMIEAAKRGYINKRDEHRELLKMGNKNMPEAMIAMEMSGAIASPVKFFKAAKAAPLGIKSRKNLLDMAANGVVYGIGISEKKEDYAKNIIGSTAGNIVGYSIGKKLYGRAGSPLLRNTLSNSINSTFQKGINLLEDKK